MWVERRPAVLLASAAALVVAVACGTQAPDSKGGDETSLSERQLDDQTGAGEGRSADTDEGGSKTARGAEIAAATEVETRIADYLDAENVAIKDGDFSGVEPFVEECRVCTASRESIEEVYDDGGRIEGSLFTEPKIDAGQQAPNGTVTVTVVSTISAYKVYDKAGTVVDSEPAKEQTFQYGVAERGGEWKIVSGEFVQ